MQTGRERPLVDRLDELYARRDEALQEGDLERVYEVQAEIGEVAARRQEIPHSDE
jgi:hypothetical protein